MQSSKNQGHAPLLLALILVALINQTNLCIDTVAPRESSDLVVQKVMQQNMSTLTWEEEDWPNEPFYDFIQRTMRYQRSMAIVKKRRVCFKIAQKHSALFNKTSENILDDTVTWDDLNLFRGGKDTSLYLAQKIDHTSTEMGKVIFYSLLAQPTCDVVKLQKRQLVIKELINNEQLFESLEDSFLKIKKVENLTLSFWANDPLKSSISGNYFKFGLDSLDNKLNYDPNALFLNSARNHQKRIFLFCSCIAASCILPIYSINKLWPLRYVSKKSKINQTSERLLGSNSPLLAFLSTLTIYNTKEWQAFIGLIAAYHCALSTKKEYKWMRDNFILINLIQEKLNHVSLFISMLREINNKINNSEILRNNLALSSELKKLFEQLSQNPEIEKLFNLLQTGTFKGESSILSHSGRILAAYKLMHDNKQYFEKALCALGELDTYFSVAKLFKERFAQVGQSQNSKYTFVEFETNPKRPSINLEDFWNPFIDQDKAVKNSWSIGYDNQARVVIITGPNAGGKSTLIKGVTINLILAQTFGIACAKKAKITPFSKIATYLNVTDDIAIGNSLFKAQVLRVENLLVQAREVACDKFWFLAFDEVFTGTAAKEGQALSYSLAKDLSGYDNNICIIATHFPKLTELENINNNFINYKVSATIDSSGKIYYPFTIERGASVQNIAIDILRAEGFKSTILDEASRIVQSS